MEAVLRTQRMRVSTGQGQSGLGVPVGPESATLTGSGPVLG